MTPWHRPRPSGAAVVETDDDDYVTVDKWPRDVFRPHYHDADFNWLVPMRAGRVVVRVEEEEIAVDGERWICVFPRTAHAVVHVSDDGEVLSSFVPERAMHEAWASQPIGRRFIVGGEATIARGLALAWAEQRFARRARDRFDDALATYVAGWLWRHYGSMEVDEDFSVAMRAAFGGDGAVVAELLERHLAEQPFPWPALARALGASSRTLQRRFLEALGQTPSVVLQRMRLARARDLLRDPSRSIGDVAAACGFASQAHFATLFRASAGVTPTAWRRAQRSV